LDKVERVGVSQQRATSYLIKSSDEKCFGNWVILGRGWKHWKPYNILHGIFLKVEVIH
jgi:hypothetical protein